MVLSTGNSAGRDGNYDRVPDVMTTQIDMGMFDDEFASDILYNDITIRAFVTLGGGQNRIVIKASDVASPSFKDKIVVDGNTRQIKGAADKNTNGEIHVLDLIPLPRYKKGINARS